MSPPDSWRQQASNRRYNPPLSTIHTQSRSIPIQYASPHALYNVIEDNRVYPNYEEPESEYYEKLGDFVHIPKTSSNTTKSSLASPPLPPLVNHHSTLQRLYCSEKGRNFPQCTRQLKLTACLLVASTVIIALISAFLWHINVRNVKLKEDLDNSRQIYDLHSAKNNDYIERNREKLVNETTANELLITANNLATLIVTKRKICIFEVSTNDAEKSREEFEQEHIQGARLLFFGNLSHSGVPVHPLQLQRYVRNLGVDSDCRVVLYDKGQQIWATYAFWLFRLFGHEKTSLLNGGFLEYKAKAKDQSNLYKIVEGPETAIKRLGKFKARWVDDFIVTFDDVIANFETDTYEIIDAQSQEEYEGKSEGAVFGHIRNAVNIPIDLVFDWQNNNWPSITRHLALFKERGLSITKPIIVYDGTSLRSSLIWFALQRMNIESAIYFGSWAEFAFRAPDNLKVIPKEILSRE